MTIINQQFRADYDGEFVITRTVFRGGQKIQEREWMENPISNQHISGRAAVIGTDNNLEQFDFKLLQNHRGGLMGSKRLQLYGAHKVWKHMPLDFYISTEKSDLAELITANYNVNNIVYTNTKNVLSNPGSFYITPFTPYLSDLALAAYLPAFDGHKEIFLLGYNKDVLDNNTNRAQDVNHVFRTYRGCKFYLVGIESNMPEAWKNNLNVNCMSYRDFITSCDV